MMNFLLVATLFNAKLMYSIKVQNSATHSQGLIQCTVSSRGGTQLTQLRVSGVANTYNTAVALGVAVATY